MLKRLAVTAALLTLVASPLRGSEHLVSMEQVRAALIETSSRRAADLSQVEEFLSRPDARRAATLAGLSLERTTATLQSLSDGELRDLAARSRALASDPAAGSTAGDMALGALLMLALVVALLAYTMRNGCC